MSPVNRQSRRNTYTSKKTSEPAKTVRKSAGNRRKSAEPAKTAKTKSSRRSRASLPRINTGGFWRVMRWIIALSFIALLFFGLALTMVKAYQVCTTSDYFAITEITVTGNSQVKTKDILEVCGLKKGENSLKVKIQQAEQALVQNPWIENAAIRRELPGRFIITIKERVPLFSARKNSRLYYVNAQGQLIAPVSPKDFRSLPVLEIGPGGEESLPVVAEFMEQFRKAGFPFDISQISWIRLSAGSGFELYWESRRLRLSIGIDNWKDNLKRIASVVTDIEKRKETVMVTSIKAADGQVWMTKSSSSQQTVAPQ